MFQLAVQAATGVMVYNQQYERLSPTTAPPTAQQQQADARGGIRLPARIITSASSSLSVLARSCGSSFWALILAPYKRFMRRPIPHQNPFIGVVAWSQCVAFTFFLLLFLNGFCFLLSGPSPTRKGGSAASPTPVRHAASEGGVQIVQVNNNNNNSNSNSNNDVKSRRGRSPSPSRRGGKSENPPQRPVAAPPSTAPPSLQSGNGVIVQS